MNTLEKIFNSILIYADRCTSCPNIEPAVLQNAKIVAHRGVHENNLAIENTMAAFSLAVENKIWGIEFDVRMSKDKVAFILHDADTKRIFQDKKNIYISEAESSYLRKYFPEIPTLQQVIEKWGGKIHLMIEIKENYWGQTHIIESFKKCLHKLKPSQDYHLLSLNPNFLHAFDFVPNEAKMDVMWLNPKEIFVKNKLFAHGSIAGHYLFFNDKNIATLKSNNRKIGVGFLESKNRFYKELNRGVDWVFTNHPIRLRKLMPD